MSRFWCIITLLLGWDKSGGTAQLQTQAASRRICSMVTMLNICCCSSKVFQLIVLQLLTVPQHHPTSLIQYTPILVL